MYENDKRPGAVRINLRPTTMFKYSNTFVQDCIPASEQIEMETP